MCGPTDAQRPLMLLVLTMWPSSAFCSIGRNARVQGFMSWESAERQYGRLRVEIVEAAITIMVAQAVV